MIGWAANVGDASLRIDHLDCAPMRNDSHFLSPPNFPIELHFFPDSENQRRLLAFAIPARLTLSAPFDVEQGCLAALWAQFTER